MSATTKKAKATYYYKLFRVKRSDGRVTTVSVDPVLAMRACQAMGGLKPVGKLVREAAMSYQDGTYKNCSSFVSLQLKQAMEDAVRGRANANAANAAPADTRVLAMA